MKIIIVSMYSIDITSFHQGGKLTAYRIGGTAQLLYHIRRIMSMCCRASFSCRYVFKYPLYKSTIRYQGLLSRYRDSPWQTKMLRHSPRQS